MSRAQRLVVVLVLNLALVAALVVVGVTAHSVGVLAAGGDYVLDAAAVAIALVALALSRRPATDRRPDGYPTHSTSRRSSTAAGCLCSRCSSPTPPRTG